MNSDPQPLSRFELFKALRERNIVKVVISFSGGNDEGGPDQITAHLADGSEQELMDGSNCYYGVNYGDPNYDSRTTNWWVHAYDRDTGETTYRAATPDEITNQRMLDALEAPIWAEYGGFAGDFSVHGTVTWDVAAETATMDKSESSYSDYSYDV